MGASCAMCAIGRATGAASASGAGGRVSRNEQVVGSIPTGGSTSEQLELSVRLGRYPLIVVDEVGYSPFEPEAADLFFQLVSSRYEHASLILTSNLPFSKAHMFDRTCVRAQPKMHGF
jgi:hypothetical protein